MNIDTNYPPNNERSENNRKKLASEGFSVLSEFLKPFSFHTFYQRPYILLIHFFQNIKNLLSIFCQVCWLSFSFCDDDM
jgi:hypothetical protein